MMQQVAPEPGEVSLHLRPKRRRTAVVQVGSDQAGKRGGVNILSGGIGRLQRPLLMLRSPHNHDHPVATASSQPAQDLETQLELDWNWLKANWS